MKLIDAAAFIERLNKEIKDRPDLAPGLKAAGLLLNGQPAISVTNEYNKSAAMHQEIGYHRGYAAALENQHQKPGVEQSWQANIPFRMGVEDDYMAHPKPRMVSFDKVKEVLTRPLVIGRTILDGDMTTVISRWHTEVAKLLNELEADAK